MYAVTDFLAILIVIAVGIYTYFKWSFTYWKRKGVPYLEPSIPFGNWNYEKNEHIALQLKRRYDEFKAKQYKHAGFYFFTMPSYVPIHPDYVKRILGTDYRYFADRGVYYNEKGDPLSANLFNLDGEKWKRVRAKLTQPFSSGKIKLMFPPLLETSRQLRKAIDGYFKKGLPIDGKEIFACFTTDVISSCAFGVKCNSFVNPSNEFRRHGKSMADAFTKVSSLGAFIALGNKKLGRLLNVKLTPADMTKFFIDLVQETVELREKYKGVAKDFMQILIDQKNSDHVNERFTLNEMAAHTFIFFFGGFETTSSTMTFCLYELARHPHLQDKVRKEIESVLSKYNGEITYEAIWELKYFDQAIDETLRIHPPVPTLPRVCVKNYKIPDTNVVIDKGTNVSIPILGLHYDAEIYPNPDEFDPDRFSEEKKKERSSFVFLPFGAGPKTCLGMRFGLTQIKLGLLLLLARYRFVVNAKTKVPLEVDPDSLALIIKGEVLFDMEELKEPIRCNF
ncbi:hypothetical protein FQA39_LY16821 [Lamprigera yunnana]|nr:hypothetical protein FQA39_LY16821 [Lamprigera yunnana]